MGRSGVESRIWKDSRFDGQRTNWGLSSELCSAVTNLGGFNTTWLTLESGRELDLCLGLPSLLVLVIFCLFFFKRIQLSLLRIPITDSMLPISLLPSNRCLFMWTSVTFNLAKSAGNSGKSPWTWMKNNVFSIASHKISSPWKPLMLQDLTMLYLLRHYIPFSYFPLCTLQWLYSV